MVYESLLELHVLFSEVLRRRLRTLATSGLLAWATCQASWGQTQSVNRYRQPVQVILTGGPTSPNAPIASLPSVNLLDEHGALREKGTYAGDADLLAPLTAGDREPVGSDASLLEAMGPAAGSTNRGGNLPGAAHGAEPASRDGLPAGLDPHAEVFANDLYPSATKCAQCHKKIYDEWRVSAHAYAAVSPMFNKFEQKMTELTQGTVGTFCFRCHAPAAVQMGFPRSGSIVDAPLVFREGVSCVACHRVKEAYGRVNGERRIEPGPIQAPVYGNIGGDGVARAIADKDNFKIKLDPNDKKPGQEIHWEGIQFEQLSESAYCQPCHQVVVHPGISLEVVWAQYRAGPACKKGIRCQDCHMGLVPGKPLGFEYGAVAEMNGKSVDKNRKHSNHMFFGPGNSIAHPGVFPHNEKSYRWTIDQWLEYDWRMGWGTEAFEQALAQGRIAAAFPTNWTSADERRDARKVLDENFRLLAVKKASSVAVMEAGTQVDGPFFREPPQRGSDLHLHYKVSNISEGHNSPSGSLGAQPQLWLNVVLTGPTGARLWESGYLDANGDLANQHSLLVAQRLIPPDLQLFNLQSQFMITGVKGTDREMYLPVNVDIDQLPFLRPATIPYTVLNHAPFVRMEQKSIPPQGNKLARYRIPGELFAQPGTYRLTSRMRSRMEPIYFMRFVEATPEMERRMLEQTIDLHPYSVEFTVP
ncbi:MAG: multiheme c-type cytochrome [Pirellulaceae bacterium]